LISIEGNIGSGKSVFCNYLRMHFSCIYNKPNNKNVYFVDEPVNEWESVKDEGGNLIEHFYKNSEKYAYCFQMTAYISRLVKLKNVLKFSKPEDIIIMERCVFSDYNVFASMLYNTGKINKIEFESYKLWFNYFLRDIPKILYVYIKASPEVCKIRIEKRNRDGENDISLDYLRSCEEYHERWFQKETNNLITLDGEKDITYHPLYLDILKQMMCYDIVNNEHLSDEELILYTLNVCNKRVDFNNV